MLGMTSGEALGQPLATRVAPLFGAPLFGIVPVHVLVLEVVALHFSRTGTGTGAGAGTQNRGIATA